MIKGKVYFDLTTNSPAVVRRVHDVFAKKGVHLLDAPVSAGPSGARTASSRLGGRDEAVFLRYKPVLDAIGTSPSTCPIGRLRHQALHNCAGYAIQTRWREVFTLGVKAGVEPLALWRRCARARCRQRTFDRIPHQFFRGKYDPPNFALRLAHKDVTLATELGREQGVPMRVANLALAACDSRASARTSAPPPGLLERRSPGPSFFRASGQRLASTCRPSRALHLDALVGQALALERFTEARSSTRTWGRRSLSIMRCASALAPARFSASVRSARARFATRIGTPCSRRAPWAR